MFEFRLPAIGEGVVEGEIVRWLKQPGDPVAANEPLVEVMTDKATVEIPSPQAAVVQSLTAEEGATAAVGSVIAILGLAGAADVADVVAPGAPGAAPRDEARGKVLATPAARALAREAGVDLSDVAGAGGRITKAHVEQARKAAGPETDDVGLFDVRGRAGTLYAESLNASRTAAPRNLAKSAVKPPVDGSLRYGEDPNAPIGSPVLPQSARTTAVGTSKTGRSLARPGGDTDLADYIPFRGMRRRIAEGMTKAYRTAVHYTYVEQIDMTKLVAVREQAKRAAAAEGVQLSYLPFIVKAVLRGLRKYPIVNAELDEPNGQIIVKRHYSIGIATATEQGLMVPVLHGADRLSLLEIAGEISRLSAAARSGSASREELTGSTFTITSLGNIGGVLATPILNYPEVGILGVHAIRKVPVVDEHDNIVLGYVMNLSVSLDHRVVDGFEGANFLQEVRRYLEDPTLLLLSGI